jgi:hypothetical protein
LAGHSGESPRWVGFCRAALDLDLLIAVAVGASIGDSPAMKWPRPCPARYAMGVLV